MSRLTRPWKRHLRPLILNTLRRFRGSRAPHDSITIADYAATSQACHRIELPTLKTESIPARAMSGDPAAVEATMAMIPDPLVRERYVKELFGAKLVGSDDSVCMLNEGRVAHDGGLVITSENNVLCGVSCIDFDTALPTNPLHLRYLPRPSHVAGSVTVVTCSMPYNYYHWMIEAVPRLGMYAEAGVGIDRVYAPTRRRFQRDTLRLLGLSDSKIIRGSQNAHIVSDQLVASSWNPISTRRTVGFLHTRLTAPLDADDQPRLRVFISRRKRGKRVVTNDAEVFGKLQPLGFKRYELETMSVGDQIELFYNADCVIGPHGAGLANIAFCREGTKVIEINTPYRTSTCFYDIAHYRGLRYQLHIAQPDHKGFFNFDPTNGLGDSNMTVEPGAFAALVRSFLAEPSAADSSADFQRYNAA
jgi:hypothetical protein